MSATYSSIVPAPNLQFASFGNRVVTELNAIAGKYSGRTLFTTGFSREDQVLAHLIFKNELPIRVFTFSGGAKNDILRRSVDFFTGNIEVSFQQARLAAADFAARHPEMIRKYEKNPAMAPLVHVLQGHHLLVSSLRQNQLPAKVANALEWDEVNQHAIYYPLLHWTEKQVNTYLAYYGIPHEPALPAPVSAPLRPAFSVWRNVLQSIIPKRKSFQLKKTAQITSAFGGSYGKQAFLGLME